MRSWVISSGFVVAPAARGVRCGRWAQAGSGYGGTSMRGNGISFSARARATWKVAVVVAVAAVACPVVMAGSASATTTPTIRLTPRTDLVDGSVVAVTG